MGEDQTVLILCGPPYWICTYDPKKTPETVGAFVRQVTFNLLTALTIRSVGPIACLCDRCDNGRGTSWQLAEESSQHGEGRRGRGDHLKVHGRLVN